MDITPTGWSETDGNSTGISWLRAFAWAAGGLYLPQLIICVYTMAAVSCSHCKQAIWMVAPVGPGLFLHGWIKQWLGWREHLQEQQLPLTIALCLLLLGGLSWLNHRFPRARWWLSLLAFCGSLIAGIGLLAAIRA